MAETKEVTPAERAELSEAEAFFARFVAYGLLISNQPLWEAAWLLDVIHSRDVWTIIRDYCEKLCESKIVLDVGAFHTKAGFAGDDAPRAVFPSVVGEPRHRQLINSQKPYYVGDEAMSKRGILMLRFPLSHESKGATYREPEYFNLWRHTFANELRLDSEESMDLLVSEPVLFDRSYRARLCQQAFEEFKVNSLLMVSSAALAMYASGRLTGLCLESGEVTTAVPIYEGYTLRYAAQELHLAGRDITDMVQRLLCATEREIERDIKARFCYVALDYKEELAKMEFGEIDKQYELPDGQTINVRHPRFGAPEILFQPVLVGSEAKGVVSLVNDAVAACTVEPDVLYKNIVLAGGSTMFPGFAERLTRDLQHGGVQNVRVDAQPERKYYVWIGASVLASLTTGRSLWMSAHEYDEWGPYYAQTKFLM